MWQLIDCHWTTQDPWKKLLPHQHPAMQPRQDSSYHHHRRTPAAKMRGESWPGNPFKFHSNHELEKTKGFSFSAKCKLHEQKSKQQTHKHPQSLTHHAGPQTHDPCFHFCVLPHPVRHMKDKHTDAVTTHENMPVKSMSFSAGPSCGKRSNFGRLSIYPGWFTLRCHY